MLLLVEQAWFPGVVMHRFCVCARKELFLFSRPAPDRGSFSSPRRRFMSVLLDNGCRSGLAAPGPTRGERKVPRAGEGDEVEQWC